MSENGMRCKEDAMPHHARVEGKREKNTQWSFEETLSSEDIWVP